MDELTHELMRIPIRLPSKKYVDKSTFDKYVREREMSKEAIVDPFTRVPFTSGHKPIIDEELKSRIDKFLFDNHSARLVPKKSPQKSSALLTKDPSEPEEDLSHQRRSKRLKIDDNKSTAEVKPALFRCDLCMNQKECSSFSSSKTFSTFSFYQLEVCKHIFCRNCLLVIRNVCSKCKTSFKNSQVTNVDKII